MELMELITLFAIIATISGVLIFTINRKIPAKAAKNQAYTSITELNNVQNDQIKEILKLKDKQVASLNASLNKMRRDLEESEEQVEENGVSWEEVKKIAASKGINPVLLEIPMIKDFGMDFIKGKSLSELNTAVEGIMQLTKGVRPQQNSEEPKIDYA